MTETDFFSFSLQFFLCIPSYLFAFNSTLSLKFLSFFTYFLPLVSFFVFSLNFFFLPLQLTSSLYFSFIFLVYFLTLFSLSKFSHYFLTLPFNLKFSLDFLSIFVHFSLYFLYSHFLSISIFSSLFISSYT